MRYRYPVLPIPMDHHKDKMEKIKPDYVKTFSKKPYTITEYNFIKTM